MVGAELNWMLGARQPGAPREPAIGSAVGTPARSGTAAPAATNELHTI